MKKVSLHTPKALFQFQLQRNHKLTQLQNIATTATQENTAASLDSSLVYGP